MSLALHLTSGTKDFSAVIARDASNTPRTMQECWVRTPNGIVQWFGKFSATAGPSVVRGTASRSTTVTVTTRTATAIPSGGVAPFTYAWTRTDSDPQVWTIGAPSSATTAFSTNVATGSEFTATFHCTITDATGSSVVTSDVTADCWNSL